MASATTQALYNWMINYRQVKGSALTRDDYTNTWGDLGAAVYDWGAQLYNQGLGADVQDFDSFSNTVDQIGTKYPVGGALGQYFAPPAPGPGVQGTFGSLGSDMYQWANDFKTRNGGRAPSAQDFQNAWGDVGLQMANWVNGMGVWPDEQSFATRADYLANTYTPGGSIGFAYQGAPTAGQEYQDWYKGYQEKQAEATQAFQNAQIALQQGNQQLAQQQLALAQKAQADANAIAQQQLAQQGQQFNTQQSGYINGQATVDRQRMEADIDATKERIRIAEEQGNAQLALDERKRLDALQIALGQQGIQEAGVTGYYGGGSTFARQQFEADLNANPRDWVKAWMYQRGQQPAGTRTTQPATQPVMLGSGEATRTPPTGQAVVMGEQGQGGTRVPSWLQSIQTNTPMAQFQGTSGSLGTFPIKAPDPNQINAKTWNRLNPSEQEGLAGLASSSGWYIPDYIAAMQKSFTKQNTQATPTWGGF